MKFLLYLWMSVISVKGLAQDSLHYSLIFESWNDIFTNVQGGLKKGTVYKGLFAFDPTLSYKLFRYSGSFCYAYGKSPSQTLIGDLQTVSNIDTDLDFFVFKSYLTYEKSDFSVDIGIIDMNEEFINCEKTEFLINSSFGIPAHISCNNTVSIFPLTCLGLNFKYNKNDKHIVKLGLYEGEPVPLPQKDLRKFFNLSGGIFGIIEYTRNFSLQQHKIGIFHHTGSLSSDTVFSKNAHNGFYLLSSLTLVDNERNNLSLFSQFSHDLFYVSNHHYYVGFGIILLFCHKNNQTHQVSAALAYIGNKISQKRETAIEINYTRQLGTYFLLQPNIQYIINPAGTESKLPNSLSLNLRVLVTYEKSN